MPKEKEIIVKIENAVVLVTGANRGLGLAFTTALVAAGARKIYAGARDPSSITVQGVEPIKLDVTRPEDVAAAAQHCPDLTLLINNAGISRATAFLAPGSEEAARAELETNYFGPLALTRAFAPILAANGGGAIINVLSVLTWVNFAAVATYCASKSAAWSLTNGLRGELRGQGTQVLGLHVGYMDTDMAKGFEVPKASPADVVRQTFEALEAGRDEILADEASRQVKLGLSAERAVYLG